MRVLRTSRLAALAVASLVGACSHEDPVTVVTRDGVDTIPVIDLAPAPANFPAGTRVTNRFLATAFDTSVADAFGRSSTNPASFYADPAGAACYGTTPLIVASGPNLVATFQAPQVYLPRLVTPLVTMEDACGGGQATNLIVPKGHPGNGTGNQVWEFWHYLTGATPGVRYVHGVARYALQVRGALDIAEILLTGTATQPDTLVFIAGDFNPAGKKARDRFTTNCASVNVIHPTAGANPHLLGSDTAVGGAVDLDQTVCAATGEAWSDLGTATSPVPKNNNTLLGANQYNFFVIWEALADSTPNYARPVYRTQIGPVPVVAGTAIINNGYGPAPAGALSAAQLALLPAATARADTIRVTANNLKALNSGYVYQLWITRAGTDTAALVTGRVIRLNGATVVDTLANVSEFNLTPGTNAARVEFDFAPHAAVNYNAAVMAVQASGAAALGTAQPLWTAMVTKKPQGGAVPSLSSTLSFGTYNKGTGPVIYGANGLGTGGLFGKELREDVKRLPRPPVGFMYEGWLGNSASSTAKNLGPIIAPPANGGFALTEADTMQSAPLSGVEITEAGFRFVADSVKFYCTYDRVQVRLAPKRGNPDAVSPGVVLEGSNPRRGC